MSVPAKRRASSSKRRRAGHFALKKVKYNLCPKCKKPKMPHAVCSYCGTYQNREVLKSKLDKKELKKLNKQKAQAAEKQKQ
ncbi:MAG: 50S ribosomal protein L32 [Candidatus Buchananbacteria bacterium RBG_13_36_9]|uniref:Large ribosomal subunit protein bL32 n=1 Tax=Candidatus Buchananbacteria bacterium RBG_13_36_9 TaxID=1797530 RepID=A0A1G1XMV2_9BACT|nr:MAG: 50S ribosomal protein L32 [Candidatus Buchananbacteria bacterium RBG_13_36_9]